MEHSADKKGGMRPSGSSSIASLKEILNLDKVIRMLGSCKFVTVAYFLVFFLKILAFAASIVPLTHIDPIPNEQLTIYGVQVREYLVHASYRDSYVSVRVTTTCTSAAAAAAFENRLAASYL